MRFIFRPPFPSQHGAGFVVSRLHQQNVEVRIAAFVFFGLNDELRDFFSSHELGFDGFDADLRQPPVIGHFLKFDTEAFGFIFPMLL